MLIEVIFSLVGSDLSQLKLLIEDLDALVPFSVGEDEGECRPSLLGPNTTDSLSQKIHIITNFLSSLTGLTQFGQPVAMLASRICPTRAT